MQRAYFGHWINFKILTLVSPYGMNPLLSQAFFDRKYEVRHFTPVFITTSLLNTSRYTAVRGHIFSRVQGEISNTNYL